MIGPMTAISHPRHDSLNHPKRADDVGLQNSLKAINRVSLKGPSFGSRCVVDQLIDLTSRPDASTYGFLIGHVQRKTKICGDVVKQRNGARCSNELAPVALQHARSCCTNSSSGTSDQYSHRLNMCTQLRSQSSHDCDQVSVSVSEQTICRED